jgi:hypothetical protein
VSCCLPSHVLVLIPPPSLELSMPFFENSKDVSINGGAFTDVKGDWNIYDHSHHVREENSRNTNTTTTTDSNNNSSRHSYTGSKLSSHLSEHQRIDDSAA